MTTELISAAIDHCRAHRIPTLVLSHHVAADEPVVSAARELGFRVLPADADYCVELPADATYASYLADLGARDRGIFLRNLRRVEDAHGVIVQDAPIGASLLEEAWPQYLEKTGRLGSLYAHRANLFHAVHTRHGDLAGTKCLIEDKMVGLFLYLRAGRSAILPYIAHVTEPPLHAWAALIVHTIRLLLDQGVTRLVLGPTHDQFKGHLGATRIEHVHCFRAIPS